MTIVLLCLSFLALVATALPLIRKEAWWIRIFDFPRVQIILLMGALLVGLMLSWSSLSLIGRTTAFLLLLATLYQFYRMLPYTRLAGVQVPSCKPGSSESDQFSLLTANVLMSNRNDDALRGLITENDPDVVLLVETDRWWEEALGSLDEDYPHHVKYPLDNTYGMLLYSKLELRGSEIRFLIDDDVPSIWTTTVLPSGVEVVLVGLHPRPPRPDKRQDSTKRDAELVVTAREIKEESRPVVVTGDLNDVAWSHTTHLFQRISRLGDPRQGRGLFNTFHAGHWFLRYPLDHVFSSRHFHLIDLHRLDSFESDHFPIYAALCLDEDADVEIPEPTGEDMDEARAKEETAAEETRGEQG